MRDIGGSGVPIVLLHALSMDASMWRAIYPRLGCRVVMYDIRGFGYARDAPATASMEQLADDLKTVLDELKIENADIYGTSYGGGVAQTFATRYPTYTRSVAILASAAKGSPILLDRATHAERYGMEYMAAPTLMRWFTAESIASNAWDVRYARTCVRRTRVEPWAAAWRSMAALGVIGRLPKITVPVLSVAGVQDLSSPPQLLKVIADLTKGKYIELNPGTHMMVLEQPDVVLKALKEFRSQVDASVS